ncbi:MAG: aldehyde ferredoxin oxidoreductase N-terminal domain-containing protein [Coriobacteriales bacterium]|jgi:aldehyde:ferredoxin oxidoreductase
MTNRTVSDIVDNPKNTLHLYGYEGQILRINLTDKTTEIISTYDYVPKYIGGRMLAEKIFYDEVGPGVDCFDPENKLIYMTGATTGTAIPTGGRSEMVGIAANNLPTQFSFGGIGGWFGSELKFAGYDGFILEGKADEHTYILIEDENVEFLNADEMWGMRVHQTQDFLKEKHGEDFKSMVIGPAGENLCRNGTITTDQDCVLAKSGFGAVFGSKNLKAITVHGTGVVAVADIEKTLELRLKMGSPYMRRSPLQELHEFGLPGSIAKGDFTRANICCSYGCNQHCNALMMGTNSWLDKGEKINHVEKCVSIMAYGFQVDVPSTVGSNWMTEQNHMQPCKMLSREFPTPDPTDPYFDKLNTPIKPDILNFWKPDFEKGNLINEMCNDYGLDKWDTQIWLLPWLAMGKKEGVFDDVDFGMEIDVENPEFVKYILESIIFRKGFYGDLLAEGMARAIRKMGKEKFGDTIYHGRISQELGGKELPLPISLETAWGHSFHWQGRGYEATVEKPTWLATTICLMVSSRDMQTMEHHHDKYENLLKIYGNEYDSQELVDSIIRDETKGEIKDSVMSCEWQSPDLFWDTMEVEAYNAATGLNMTQQELVDAASRSKLLYRAILIRNHDRDREMEVNAVWPGISIPDTRGEVADWDGFNRLVDRYYDTRGWDRATAWPYRETWEKYGLGYIADEMEKIGKLPKKE